MIFFFYLNFFYLFIKLHLKTKFFSFMLNFYKKELHQLFKKKHKYFDLKQKKKINIIYFIIYQNEI